MSLKNTVQNILFQFYLIIGVYAFALALIMGLSIHNRVADDTLNQDNKILFIPSGKSSLFVASKIAEYTDADVLVLYGAIKIMDKHIKSGEYVIYPHMKGLDILNDIENYTIKQRKITIPNGAWYGHMDKIIDNTAFINNKSPMPRNKIVWAETYFYERDTHAKDLIIRMQELYLAHAERMWQNRDKTLPLKSLSQAFVLASMVERETSIKSEQPIVAGVFINRLRKNMRLQSDPTVIYAVTNGTGLLNRPISKADLKYDSPYNTYVYRGLPPTPIASVGLDTLQSVLHPKKHGYYYFVASPEGGHAFSKTLQKHNRNVAVYQAHLKQNKK